MENKKLRAILCAAAAAAVLTAVASMAAGGAGSQSDPLVTLSYLTETFTSQIMDRLDSLLASRNLQLTQELTGQILEQPPQPSAGASGTAPVFTAVTLAPGQTLSGGAGCELLLRSGAASCISASPPGLVDATSGGSIGNGAALQANHLYMMTDARSVYSASGATFLARGDFTVF